MSLKDYEIMDDYQILFVLERLFKNNLVGM